MKILINTPHLKEQGGVANHFKGLKKYWTEEVHYNFIAGRYGIPGAILFPVDLIKFFLKCICLRPQVVLLNPSLAKTALKRDSWFLWISKLLNKKTLVFFHGWNEEQASKISMNPSTFLKSYNRADAFVVLASEFKIKLISWGINKPIMLSTTKVDDSLLRKRKCKKANQKILFLARIEENKGIFIAIQAFKKILIDFPEAQFIVAGAGSALESSKKMVINEGISNIKFLGNISGVDMQNAFETSNLYILPTFHGEGMPTSVLEAMAFGLPIITRPVGGIKDFFEIGEMGYLIDSLQSDDFAVKIIELFKNEEKLKQIGNYNSKYARDHFLASKIAKELQHFCGQIYKI